MAWLFDAGAFDSFMDFPDDGFFDGGATGSPELCSGGELASTKPSLGSPQLLRLLRKREKHHRFVKRQLDVQNLFQTDVAG